MTSSSPERPEPRPRLVPWLLLLLLLVVGGALVGFAFWAGPARIVNAWPRALLGTGVAVVLAAILLGTRGWLARAFESSRFFAASLVFHLVLLLVLAYWSLPTVMQIIVTNIQEAEAASQPFDDNQHQSHEDGQQAWEKLADLQALETTVEVIRRETDPLNIPNETSQLKPTISLERARLLPSDQVLYAPPPAEADVRDQQPLSSRTMASPAAPIDVADVSEEVVLEATPTPEPDQPVVAEALPRSASESELTRKLPRRAVVAPRAIELEMPAEDEQAEPLQLAAAGPPRPEVARAAALVELSEDPQTPIVPLPKTEPAGVTPQPLAPARATPADQPRQHSRPVDVAVRRTLTAADEPGPSMDETRPAPLLAEPRRNSSRPAATADLASAEQRQPLPPEAATPGRLPGEPVQVELNRAEVQPPRIEVPTPREVSGPAQPERRLVAGELSTIKVDVPPTFGPIVSRLNRPRAKATRVIYAEDSVGMREMFTLRQGDIRKQYVELFGGTEQSEKAVNDGLAWLAVHQNADGSWSLNKFHENCKGKHDNCGGAGNIPSNTAATGLALLPFLAAGHTHQTGEYQQQVAAALKWFGEKQKENGDLLAPGDQQHLYSHSIAAIALCEVYGMSNDPQLRPLVEKALDFIVKAQHAGTGGWRYSPNQAADTSVVGWAMMALKSGEMAGVLAPQPALDNVARWLQKVEGNKPVGGTFGYQNANATPAMTAEGLLCLQFLGAARNDPRMRAGADYLLKNLPDEKQSRTSYYWYYGTQVMYHMQGAYWEAWNERLRDHLVNTQVKEGPLAGTWDPRDNWESRGGRIYATSLKLLMLEVYYRHLPLFEQLEE